MVMTSFTKQNKFKFRNGARIYSENKLRRRKLNAYNIRVYVFSSGVSALEHRSPLSASKHTFSFYCIEDKTLRSVPRIECGTVVVLELSAIRFIQNRWMLLWWVYRIMWTRRNYFDSKWALLLRRRLSALLWSVIFISRLLHCVHHLCTTDRHTQHRDRVFYAKKTKLSTFHQFNCFAQSVLVCKWMHHFIQLHSISLWKILQQFLVFVCNIRDKAEFKEIVDTFASKLWNFGCPENIVESRVFVIRCCVIQLI